MNQKLENRNYLIFSLIFIVLSFYILRSFMSGIIWGAVIGLSVWPLCEYLNKSDSKYFKNKTINALIVSFTLSLFFIFPIFYAILELSELYEIIKNYIAQNLNHGMIYAPNFLNKLPYSNKLIGLWDTYISKSSSILELTNYINKGMVFSIFAHIWNDLTERLIALFVMLISCFFMLKNGEFIQKNYEHIFCYWIGKKSIAHVNNGLLSLRGTINGVVLIGILEGILLSIPLIIGDVPSGFLIALVAGILGVIPLLMPLLIVPCLGYMYLYGDITWAFIGLGDLVVVWFIFENILKPQMISKSVKINSLIILISMIGGMQVIGPLGLFVGPAIVSMSIGMLKDFILIKREDAEDLNDPVS